MRSPRPVLPPEAPSSFTWGPLFLLVPLLSLAIGLLWERGPRESSDSRLAAPPPLDQSQPVPGWSSEYDLKDGSRLEIRLTPLFADVQRQAFDTVVLRERFGWEQGMPWRLFLARSGPDHAGDLSAPFQRPPTEELLAGSPPGRVEIDLGEALVQSSAGALRVAVTLEAQRGRPFDPVDVLLSASAEPLDWGQDVSLVLWGPTPEDNVSLVLGEQSWALMPDEVAREQVVRSLARLESGPSEENVQEEESQR